MLLRLFVYNHNQCCICRCEHLKALVNINLEFHLDVICFLFWSRRLLFLFLRLWLHCFHSNLLQHHILLLLWCTSLRSHIQYFSSFHFGIQILFHPNYVFHQLVRKYCQLWLHFGKILCFLKIFYRNQVLDSSFFCMSMLQEHMLQRNIIILQELRQKQDW